MGDGSGHVYLEKRLPLLLHVSQGEQLIDIEQ